MKRKVASLVLVLWVISLGVTMIASAISANRVDSWLIRAKDAGNPAQVAEFLSEYKDALSRNGLIEGRYMSVWKYPADFMPVYIRTIDGLIGRARVLSKIDSGDTSYQMGLVNLEKDLGDINTAAWAVYMAGPGFLSMLSMICAGLILSVLLGTFLAEY